jgi:hypothetical protein
MTEQRGTGPAAGRLLLLLKRGGGDHFPELSWQTRERFNDVFQTFFHASTSSGTF